ncbi:polyprenol phosphomannose-dependent alpha 1,6 mannosyltransferase MptB [Actinomadura chokoriensis]|uniref:Polyprenol phosphomannose-dependent alpha 1,6 mannosyltransferase MptB n=1 Tax=Actinomadura chokoriensis TaxID=454156 RepID=A0ABV4QQU1_9ACTN
MRSLLTSGRGLGAVAVTAIGACVCVITAAGLWGPSGAVVTTDSCLCLLGARPSPSALIIALWLALIAGACGTMAGLAALRRGWRPRPRVLAAGGLLIAAVFVLLPAMGSSDMLNYAAFGRMSVLGHSPYEMTPIELRRLGDPIGLLTTKSWEDAPSVYGPVATATEWAASRLGGTSMAWTIFWLKVWNGAAFALGALALDRMAERDPARRARAHLLWTLNPLLLWHLIGGGHVDGLCAGLAIAALWAGRRALRPGSRPGAVGFGVAAGVLLGAAVGSKAPFALLGLGMVWAARRSPWPVAGGALGASAVLVPGYLATGPEAIRVLVARGADPSWIGPWKMIMIGTGGRPPSWVLSWGVLALTVLVAVVFLRGLLPRGGEAPPPDVRVALAFGLAWTVVSPVYFPWYEAMLFPLVALVPASRLDGIEIGRTAVASVASVPGLGVVITALPMQLTAAITAMIVTPLVLLVTGIMLVHGSLARSRRSARAGSGPVDRDVVEEGDAGRGRVAASRTAGDQPGVPGDGSLGRGSLDDLVTVDPHLEASTLR